jgi:hypothetical protein
VTFVVAVVAAVVTGGGWRQGPPAPPQPNPYQTVQGWAKMPEGRTWGSTSAVEVAKDGKSLWVAERCAANTCAGSSLPAILLFDETGRLKTSFGAGMFVFPHGIHVDGDGNVWVTDARGKDGKGHQVFKFSPEGKVLLTLGKAGVTGAGPDTFNQPSDVAVGANGDIFVADGHGPGGSTNNRIVKFDKNGKFLKTWGSRGTAPGQFNTVHSIATDAAGNVYVGDRGNKRVQVFDNNGTLKTMYLHVGAPWALCVTPGPHQYLYSSNSNGTADMENGEIYKMELDGKVVGKFGSAGKRPKEFGLANSIDCRSENELLVGEMTNWRVQKVTLKGGAATR